jgi:hypothetical protein
MLPDARTRTHVPLPVWVPEAARLYLSHTGTGRTLRELARDTGCHASTVLRQVRKVEARREDLLVDLALDHLGATHFPAAQDAPPPSTRTEMTAMRRETPPIPSDDVVEREARRILRRLSEPGACLAVAKDMEKAVVVREAGGQTVRTGVVDRPVAEAMALNDWIACETPGRISRYQITQAGRAALKRLLADDARDAFGDQHRDIEERDEMGADGRRTGRRVRYNMAESPLALLARRRDKDGQAFLTDRMVLAGERLREDFELAQMGPRVAQNWDRFLTAGDRGAFAGDGGMAEGPKAARDRVLAALTDLGPGLGDERHPEKAHRADQAQPKKPAWIRVKAPGGEAYNKPRAGSCATTGWSPSARKPAARTSASAGRRATPR